MLVMGLLVAGSAAVQDRPDLTGHWVLKDAPPLDSAATADTTAGSTADTAAGLTADTAAGLTADTAAGSMTDSTADSTAGATAPPIRSDFHPILRRRGKPAEEAQLRRLMGMAGVVRGFRIEQSDTSVTIINDDGFSYSVHPGARRDSLVDGGETIWVRARWRGQNLEIEYRPPGGGRIIETYALADSGIFLRVEVVIEHDLLAQRLWRPRMYRLEDDP